MKRSVTLLTIAGIGIGLIYFLDPKRGQARRDLVKDKVSGVLHDAKEKLSKTQREVNRDYLTAGNRQF